jgi:transcriptional regulator with XRE-family HTH domain
MKALAEQITEHTSVTISSGQISDWENGYKNPSAPGLIALSLYFQVSTDWILKGSDTPNEEMELDRQFRELTEQDKAFVKRYLELALLHKDITISSQISSRKFPRRTKRLSAKAMPVVMEQSQDYAVETRYAFVLPQDSYEPEDLVALQTSDGFTIELFKNGHDARILGKVINEAALPSE